jgi:hypothetical protein
MYPAEQKTCSVGEINRAKSDGTQLQVIPIRWQDIDLNDVFDGLLVIRTSFQIKYLGLFSWFGN